jgi:hypothetical protein
MRKFLLVTLLAASFCANANAQDTAKHSKWGTYLSPGISYSQGSVGYGLEIGIYNPKVWIALTNETYSVKPFVMMTGFRFYYTLFSCGNFYFYANAAAKYVDNNQHILVLEPGIALGFQPFKHVAFQLGGSVPFTDGSPAISGCLCVNYYF